MNPLLIIFLASAITGAFAWLITRSVLLKRLSDLQSRAKTAEDARAVLERENADLSKRLQDVQSALADISQQRSVFETKAEMLSRSVAEMWEKNADLEGNLKTLQEKLTASLEEKARLSSSFEDLGRQFDTIQQREADLVSELNNSRMEITKWKEDNAGLAANYAAVLDRLKEQQQFLDNAQSRLKDAFGNLSAEALQKNNTSFVELAKAKLDEKVTEAKGLLEKKEQAIGELVKPLSESLSKMDTKIQDLEGKRIRAYSDIWNYLDQVKTTTEGLKKETSNLVGALKTSHSRGRYGELALRRLVEHVGMFEHCHFEEQVNVEDESGRLRPDMIIKLPGEKVLVVDSKAPLSAYMKMFETDDAGEQKALLSQHVFAVKEHVKKLSAKSYWSQFKEAPDFVIMYIHIESSYGVALQAWPEMIEEAMKNRIIIATPTVLLSILLGVGYSWNQLKTMENIESIRDAAVELHDRTAVLIDHLVSVGKGLSSTMTHYNKAVGSLEGSFLPSARKINTLAEAYTKKQIPELPPLETSVRPLTILNAIPEQTGTIDLNQNA